MTRRRLVFAGLAVVTVGAGLFVHLHGSGLGHAARDVLGDALWAMMIAWLLGAAAPRTSLATRSAMAYGVCVAVELSQLYRGAWLDRLRDSMLGHLVLGSGFDARDLAAYAAGVAIATALEAVAARGVGA